MPETIQNLLEVSPQKKTANRVMRMLAGEIINGTFKVGDRVPSERKLSKFYDAPLYAIRLAIQQLKEDCFLESRPKSGVYVIDEPSLDYIDAKHFNATTFENAQADTSFANTNSFSEFANSNHTNVETSQADGFNLIGVPMQKKRTLHFAISGWYSGNKTLWQQACANYELESGGRVEIVPHFPHNYEQYEAMQQDCDIFICTYPNLAIAGLEDSVAPIDINHLQEAGVQQRYIDAAKLNDEFAIGMPLSATLLMGLLDTDVLPKDVVDSIEAAQDMIEVLKILLEAEHTIDNRYIFNFCPETCFNTMQMLFAQAGGLISSTTDLIELSSPRARQAIDAIDNFVSHSKTLPRDVWWPTSNKFATLIEYIPNMGRVKNIFSLKPWAYPLADTGKYLEGINIFMINRKCAYFDTAIRFSEYLTNCKVQKSLFSTAYDFCVSKYINNPFSAFPKQYQKVMRQMHQRAVVDKEFITGYSKMLHEIFYPSARLWLNGSIKTDDFINIVQERGNAHLGKAKYHDNTQI